MTGGSHAAGAAGRRGCQRFILTGKQLFGWKLSVLLVTNVRFNLSLVLSASLIEHLLWAGIFLRLIQSTFWLYLKRLMQSSKINNLIFLRKSIAKHICFQFAHKVKNAWNHSLISWTFVSFLLEKTGGWQALEIDFHDYKSLGLRKYFNNI